MPGRVWTTRKATWVPDVAADSNFPRAPIAAREGLHGAFAAPILRGADVLGVIEFFSDEVREPDADLLETIATVGSQIGQFLERTRTEEALREAEARMRSVVNHVVDGIITINECGTVESFNPAAERIFAFRPASMSPSRSPTIQHCCGSSWWRAMLSRMKRGDGFRYCCGSSGPSVAMQMSVKSGSGNCSNSSMRVLQRCTSSSVCRPRAMPDWFVNRKS